MCIILFAMGVKIWKKGKGGNFQYIGSNPAVPGKSPICIFYFNRETKQLSTLFHL